MNIEKAIVNKFEDFEVHVPKTKFDIPMLNKYKDFKIEEVSVKELIDTAKDIIRERHHMRNGKGEYVGVNMDMCPTEVSNLSVLYMTRKKYEFIKFANKEVDIIILAYQNSKDVIFVEALFEHFFPYIFYFNKRYLRGNNLSLTDGDLISESVIVLVQCMERYKLGYFVAFYRDWIRYRLTSASRTKNFDLMKVSVEKKRNIWHGKEEAPRKYVVDKNNNNVIDMITKDKDAENTLIYSIDKNDKKLFDKVLELVGVERGVSLCYSIGVFTPDNRKYTLKEIGDILDVSQSTVSRRRKQAVEILKTKKFFTDLLDNYKKTNRLQ